MQVHIKHLTKGDVLMREGEMSNSMYWVQSGTLRLFKKKGNGFIELGVLHSGEVVGEMSFLDNQPRSASVEALQNCDVVEIPRGKFEEFMGAQPSWMKSLLQTLVKRMRTTNNRIRELESASTVYASTDTGQTTKIHEFLSSNEILKLASALVLVTSRNSEKQPDGSVKVKAGWFQLYGSHIFTVHLSKIQVFLDVLQDAKLLRIDKQKDHVDLFVPDVSKIEQFLYWLHEENSKTEDKQLQLSAKGITILDGIAEFGGLANTAPGTETISVDMEQVFQKMAAAKNVKFPFEWTSFEELVKAGLSAELRVAGAEKSAAISVARFQKLYPVLSLRQRFRDLNAQKRGEPA